MEFVKDGIKHLLANIADLVHLDEFVHLINGALDCKHVPERALLLSQRQVVLLPKLMDCFYFILQSQFIWVVSLFFPFRVFGFVQLHLVSGLLYEFELLRDVCFRVDLGWVAA